MKRILIYTILALLNWAMLSCDRSNGADGINGTNGIDGIDGKTVLSGKGAPATSLGSIGEFYLNLDTYDLYGPKSDKGWGSPISLIGAKGNAGIDGKDGADGQSIPKIWTGDIVPTRGIGNEGDYYLNLKTKILYGPKLNGTWGEGIVLGGEDTILRGNYMLSLDGKILHQWLGKTITHLDMEADEELRNVEIIGNAAFRNANLKTIVLPNGLKHIGRYAFAWANLENISIPSNVEYIGEYAFLGNQLTSVVIPNGVMSIGNYAFDGNQLTNVYIPNSVTSIGDEAFGNNQLTSVVIPNSVRSIGRAAFAVNQLTNVYIPNSVTSIGDEAFFRNQLTSVVIPNSVRSIGRAAFAVNQLTNVSVPNGVTSIGDYAFAVNQLTSVVMKSSTPPSIGSSSFYYNSNLKIYVPQGSVNVYKNHNDWQDYKDIIVEE